MKKCIPILSFVLAVGLGACAPKAPPAPNFLIMLTEAPSGISDATFLPIDSLEHCETRAAAAKKVFPVAGIKYVAHYCAKSELAFEPFLHNPEPTGTKYFFDLAFAKDATVLSKLTPYESQAECEQNKTGTCVVSYQNTK